MTPPRFTLLHTIQRTLAAISHKDVLTSTRAVADWLHAATLATGRPDKCFRNALYHADGRVSWLYPNSNTAELISTWLDLAILLEDPALKQNARHYADGLLNDPIHGLYRGPERAAWGLPWYWTDAGTYSGLYALRLPAPLHRLAQETGDARYLDRCLEIGETLLSRLLPSGIVSAAWHPASGWLKEERVGSRYFYAVATFATLWKITGRADYKNAFHQTLEAMIQAQRADGAFFHAYDPETLQPADRSVKLHFISYLLDAITQAHEITREPALLECARRLGDYLATIFYYRHTVPYAVGEVMSAPDRMEADSALGDAAPGLFWLSEATSDHTYTDIALKLWWADWLHQLPAEHPQGWAGAIVRGINPTVKETLVGIPQNRKHLHADPSVIARSDLWFAVHHVATARRLLPLIQRARQAALKQP